MAKLTLSDPASLSNEASFIALCAANNAATETAMENTLSRDGTAPNEMDASLDMNSNRVINLPEPINGAEPLRLQDYNTLVSGGTIQAYPQATYVTLSTNADLTNERVLTAGDGIEFTDGGAGSTLTVTNIGGSFSDRAAVAAATISSSKDHLLTGGFAVEGDGGHDVLKRSASDPSLASNFQIQSADGAYWHRGPTRYEIDARQIGVKADGTTDDAAAIQQGLDYLATVGGGTLILPAGVIICNSSITISSSETELQGRGYGTELRMLGGTSIILHNATTEVNRSAVRHMIVSRGSGTATTDVGVWFKKTRRCQASNILFLDYSGTVIQIGDQAGGFTAVGIDISHIRGTATSTAVNGIKYDSDADTGDMFVSDVSLDGGEGAGIKIGGAGVGAVDGLQVSNCLFTAFNQGLHLDAPAGGGFANTVFNNVIFDCGIEDGAGNTDTILIAMSGGTINSALFNNCKVNAYHSTGTKVNCRITISSGTIAGLSFNHCRFTNSYTGGMSVEHTGGTFEGFRLTSCIFDEGSRASTGSHSAVYMTGAINDVVLSDNIIRQGGPTNWDFGFDLSALTDAVPYIGVNQVQNTASGSFDLAAAHSADGIASKFWSADGTAKYVSRVPQNFEFTGIASPAQITADQNDYSPTGLSTATVLRLSSDASRTITGLAGGATGRILVIHNVGSNNIVLADSSASSSAANRFALTAALTLEPDAVAILQYDGTSSRWRAVSGGGGSGSGDVVGPASSTDNAPVRFDGATGKLVQDSSGITISDAGAISITGSTAFFTPLNLISTEGSSSGGPYIIFTRDSPTPASGDVGGVFQWNMDDAAGNQFTAGSLSLTMTDATNGSEDTNLTLTTVTAGSLANEAIIGNGLQLGAPTSGAPGTGSINVDGVIQKDGSQVVAARKTGWSTATGTATRTTFDTATVTTAQLAERVKALIDDLHSTAGHGLIGT